MSTALVRDIDVWHFNKWHGIPHLEIPRLLGKRRIWGCIGDCRAEQPVRLKDGTLTKVSVVIAQLDDLRDGHPYNTAMFLVTCANGRNAVVRLDLRCKARSWREYAHELPPLEGRAK